MRELSMKLTLHHVGMLVKDIRASVATYASMGYEIRSEVIHDPVQTAFVQFLKLPADRAYLELISPDGPGGKLNNALLKGGGLNHLCFSTEDFEADCKSLRDAGFFLIAEPVPAVAFGGRKVAWFRSPDKLSVELVEIGEGGL